METIRDRYDRRIDYMRISITDRCNLRCRYCMPEGVTLTECKEILTFEEIVLICKAAVRLGICRFKITGGEPLVRLDCPQLVGMIRQIPGVEQVTLTTNGVVLDPYLDELCRQGLDAVNISLDTLNPAVYEKITGFDKLAAVRENIEKAVNSGLPVKVNSVLQKGVNDSEWEALAGLAEKLPVDVRFIEMMPIGFGKAFEPVKGEEVLSRLRRKYPEIRKDDRVHGNGPACYYKIPGFAGSIGFISAVHERFCSSCNRIRLTARGELKPCLCYENGVDVKRVIRELKRFNEAGEKDSAGPKETAEESEIKSVMEAIREAIRSKPRQHCFETCEGITESRQMVEIGG